MNVGQRGARLKSREGIVGDGGRVYLAPMADPKHLDRLKAGVEAWNAWREEQSLQEVDLRGADLSGLDLRGADLWYAKLQGARLRGTLLAAAVLDRADLSGADLRGANLFGARLRGALMDRTVLDRAALAEADLTVARVVRSSVDATIFTGAVLLGTNFHETPVEAALGLAPDAGWNQDAPAGSDPAADPPGLRDGLRRTSGA